MNPKQLEKLTDTTIDYWISEYQRYDWDKILMKPAENSWSLGQVGVHLCLSSKGFFFKNAERCLNKEGTSTEGRKKAGAYFIYVTGMLPPFRYEMPSQVSVQPRQPESKEQLIQKMEEVKQLAHQYIARIPQSDPALKIKHPFLGWLNTAEWIELCNIHFKHHLRQKKRIEKHFGW